MSVWLLPGAKKSSDTWSACFAFPFPAGAPLSTLKGIKCEAQVETEGAEVCSLRGLRVLLQSDTADKMATQRQEKFCGLMWLR